MNMDKKTADNINIENLSDDIGGHIRVKTYLDSLRWSGHTGFLLCLIDNKEGLMQSHVGELFKESSYLALLAQGRKPPLQVLFASYSDFSRRSGYLTPDKDGLLYPYASTAHTHADHLDS